MILLIDNYDSFSYNVYQLTAAVEPDVKVIRNDEMSPEEIEALCPSHIILSPGPGKPADAGICEEVIRRFAGRIPILGICLGHQAICEVFGAKVTYAKKLMHGKCSQALLCTDSVLFQGMPEQITVARYHSLAADEDTMPESLRVTAKTQDGEIMAVEHRTLAVYGVQFHPESVLTPEGAKIMENFIRPGHHKEQNQIRRETADREKGRKKMIGEAIQKLTQKQDIGYEMAKQVMDEIMSGTATDVQKSAYLTALSMKGETVEEITGSAEEMRRHALEVHPDRDVLEIVGTGGDGSNSFNISTTAALIIAAAGVPVAKHGNRAASSKSGAADCLEALGVNIVLEPSQAERLIREAGICFFFAQKYHTAMKYVGPIRKELGIRTVFNILGPLTNPAKPVMQVMGVYDESLLESMAHVLANLGVKKGMVVYGREKLDEISICGPTSICSFHNGQFKNSVITPEEVGLRSWKKGELLGGTPQENAQITRDILTGQEKGAKRDAAVINAAAALFVAGKASNLKESVKLAQSVVDSGKAYEKLEQFVRLSNA